MSPKSDQTLAAQSESAIPARFLPAHWRWSAFAALSSRELYAALALRARVFVLEQQCAFVDPDGCDLEAFHLLGFDGHAHMTLVAYLRVLLPGNKYEEPSIGRVTIAPSHRRTGLGRQLLVEGLKRTRLQFPGAAIRIGAQQHLQRFYESVGFRVDSAPYLEDGIAHVEMLLRP